VIEARADGKRRWTATIELASARDRQMVTVPVLEDVPVNLLASEAPAATRTDVAPVMTPVPQSTTLEVTSPPRAGGRGLKVASVAFGAASLVGFAVTGYYGWRAHTKNEASRAGCDGDVCDPVGRADRLAALSAGGTATITLVAATLTATAAVTLWVIDRKTRAGHPGPSTTIRGGLAFDPVGEGVLVGFSLSR
jgi:hypothetical protein